MKKDVTHNRLNLALQRAVGSYDYYLGLCNKLDEMPFAHVDRFIESLLESYQAKIGLEAILNDLSKREQGDGK